MKVGIANGDLGESLVLETAKDDRIAEFCTGVVGGEETGVEFKLDLGDESVFLDELVMGFEGRGGYTSLSVLFVMEGFSSCEGRQVGKHRWLVKHM